jgi:hypothetical protein
MKTHAKKRRASHARHAPKRTHKTPSAGHLRSGAAALVDPMPLTEVASAAETFTPMETGSPDRDEGRGPLGQEGEGEAQNDQVAALEEIEPRFES